jgi:hypothetical protein
VAHRGAATTVTVKSLRGRRRLMLDNVANSVGRDDRRDVVALATLTVDYPTAILGVLAGASLLARRLARI